MTGTFLKLMSDTEQKIQKPQWTPRRMNVKARAWVYHFQTTETKDF